jgi:hypothetical protein
MVINNIICTQKGKQARAALIFSGLGCQKTEKRKEKRRIWSKDRIDSYMDF